MSSTSSDARSESPSPHTAPYRDSRHSSTVSPFVGLSPNAPAPLDGALVSLAQHLALPHPAPRSAPHSAAGPTPASSQRRSLAELVAGAERLRTPSEERSPQPPTPQPPTPQPPGAPKDSSPSPRQAVLLSHAQGHTAGAAVMVHPLRPRSLRLHTPPREPSRQELAALELRDREGGDTASSRETSSHGSVPTPPARPARAPPHHVAAVPDDIEVCAVPRYVLWQRVGTTGGLGTVYRTGLVARDATRPDAQGAWPVDAAAPELVVKSVRRRAVRRLLPSATSAEHQALSAELGALQRLRHPHVGALYECIDDPMQQVLHLVLETVPDGPIARVGPEGRCPPLSVATIARYMGQAAAALQYVHSRGVCHGNVTPANVLLDHARQRAVLVDTGLAAALVGAGSHSTRTPSAGSQGSHPLRAFEIDSTGTPIPVFVSLGTSSASGTPGRDTCSDHSPAHAPGTVSSTTVPSTPRSRRSSSLTPATDSDASLASQQYYGHRATTPSHGTAAPMFAAPEFFDGAPPTPAADLWALGATLYTLLHGVVPYRGRSLAEQLHHVRHRPLRFPPSSPAVQRWHPTLRALLAPDPAARMTLEELLATGLLQPPPMLEPLHSYSSEGEYDAALGSALRPCVGAVVPAPGLSPTTGSSRSDGLPTPKSHVAEAPVSPPSRV